MKSKLQELWERLVEIDDLQAAAAVLDWDQLTYMPPGGAPARARQISTLKRLAHDKSTDPGLGKLLEELRSHEASLPYDSDEASLIRVARRDYEKAQRVPPRFMAELQGHIQEATHAWTRARPANDFQALVPCLEKTLDLTRRFADFFPGYEHIADPVIDFFTNEDIKASAMRGLLGRLREELVPMVQAIAAQPVPDDLCLRQTFPEAQQLAFGLEVLQRFGYDLERGREDKTYHPFCTAFSVGDVRVTTRVKENDLREALFGTLHEGGHGLYEQGIDPALEGTPLARGASSGVHESQSRLWENIVGRSRGFWQFFYPRLQAVFPGQLGTTPLDTFYRAINKVQPSFIRLAADEVTYNLHIMLRFEIELDLLERRIAVRDLPEVWRERFKATMGIVPPDNRDGVIQDIHWFGVPIGAAYLGYTLGNTLNAQFFETAVRAHPEIRREIEQGEFGALHGWLKENIYRHGRKYTATELVQRVIGGPLSIEPYVRYLKAKYGELYGLKFDQPRREP